MKALITGASSGIGRDIAKVLSKKGYDLIITARREDRLAELKSELATDVRILTADLSKEEECLRLYEAVKDEDIDILINNAGYGVFGAFDETDLDAELNMIDLNIISVHILMKLFLKDFIAKDKGYILNVASSAAFMPGPLFSSYYASKAYVLRLTQAVHEELRHAGRHVYVGALCPGPVNTEFNQTAGVAFGMHGLSSEYVAEYTVKKMFAGKTVIVPGAIMKGARFFSKLLPDSFVAKMAYGFQDNKNG
ncbi:MAG: SDR family oxidoreductase [Christensenella sp.]|uniref:SDR family NAD(P)-dependent oxidoreductase n=1 Tax=Christensenella sp. TaxID=1935934 RepID=UPI002B1FA782|nr:SDR family oxidoreductase [Christensenella sp.]MEA5003085.1 SDR family oxidoreductase [Christensenella sp.]